MTEPQLWSLASSHTMPALPAALYAGHATLPGHVAGHAADTRPRKQSLQQLHYGDRTASLKYTKMVPEVGSSDGCPPRVFKPTFPVLRWARSTPRVMTSFWTVRWDWGLGTAVLAVTGHGSHETIDTDTGNQESSIGPSSATAKHLTNQSTFRWFSSIVYVDNWIGNFGNYLL